MNELIFYTVGGVFGLIFIGFPMLLKMFYRKVDQSKAIVRNGLGGSKVSFGGMWVIPILHQWEIMDVSVKSVEIERVGKDGLICQDNLRADIKVAFFVRVNHTEDDVLRVAKAIGIEKASYAETLMTFFEAKFSEALKTVGKKFDFVHLYTERDTFKKEILQLIGKDLNGFVLDDAAIDYLEQTDIKFMNVNNVLDSEGIKKITELTAEQAIRSNKIQRDKEKTIAEQDVSTREAILELEKQQAQAEQKQRREIENIKAKENATIKIIEEEERLKSETVRIKTEEELMIAEENKTRQVIVAQKSKEATEAVEIERVDKQRLLERTEKEKLVSIATIEKDKEVEKEKKNIQEVIKERVMVEKAVVAEEEKIKDTRAFAEAQRAKEVNIKNAESVAEAMTIERVKTAEAERQKATILAEKDIVIADTELKTAYKTAEAKKILADATAEEEAASGVAEARVVKAKSEAIEMQGFAEAKVIKEKTAAEAEGIKAKNIAEAEGIRAKTAAESEGISKKADAMKKLDGVGREHEEFKLRLNKERDVDLARININKDIAEAQAMIISEGLKNSKIDIVGGETMFFDKLVNSITFAKQIDNFVEKSQVVSEIKDKMMDGKTDGLKEKLKGIASGFGINLNDIKNVTISAALMSLMSSSKTNDDRKYLEEILSEVKKAGIENNPVNSVMN